MVWFNQESFFKPKIERKSYWIIFCSLLELNNELNSDFLPFHLILDVAACLQHLNYINSYSKPKNDNFIISPYTFRVEVTDKFWFKLDTFLVWRKKSKIIIRNGYNSKQKNRKFFAQSKRFLERFYLKKTTALTAQKINDMPQYKGRQHTPVTSFFGYFCVHRKVWPKTVCLSIDANEIWQPSKRHH